MQSTQAPPCLAPSSRGRSPRAAAGSKQSPGQGSKEESHELRRDSMQHLPCPLAGLENSAPSSELPDPKATCARGEGKH